MKLTFKIIIGIGFCLYMAGCKNQGHSDKDGASAAAKSSGQISNTVKRENKKADKEFNQADLHKLLQDYIKAYKDTLKLDTSFDYNGRKIKISFRHYCTYDSALRLPDQYIKIYGLKEFITHDFKSILKIWSGEHLILDTIITKEMFRSKIFSEEEKFGVLLYPNISFSSNSLSVDYSLSIPLTDVGVGASLECSYDGALIIKNNY